MLCHKKADGKRRLGIGGNPTIAILLGQAEGDDVGGFLMRLSVISCRLSVSDSTDLADFYSDNLAACVR